MGLTHDGYGRETVVMAHAHDGRCERSVASARAGDGSFLFLSRTGVDFALTGGVSGYESLFGVTDLQSWVRAGFRLDVDVSDKAFADALTLRRALWQLFRASLDGQPLSAAAISVLNSAARSAPMTRQLDRSAEGWRWQRPVSLAEVMSAVSRDAIELLAVDDRSRLRECAAHNCALIFFDDSRSGRRRWCAPQRCGDRARARDYRARQKAAG